MPWPPPGTGGSGLPAGGSAGDHLVKQTSAAGDAAWEAFPDGAHSATIGDAVATSYPVAHNLATTDVIVQLWDLTGTDPVEATTDAASITATDNNTVTVVFAAAPAANSYRVVVLKSGSGGGGAIVGDWVDLPEQSTVPGAPAAGHLRLLAFEDDRLVFVNDAGFTFDVLARIGTSIAFIGAESAEGAGTLTVALPAGAASGDMALFLSASVNSVPNANGPDGDNSWTQIWRVDISTNEYCGAWVKFLGGAEPADYDLTFTGSEQLAGLAVYRGVNAVRASDFNPNTYTTEPGLAVAARDLILPIWYQIAGTGPSIIPTPGQNLTQRQHVTETSGNIKEIYIADTVSQDAALASYSATGASSNPARGCGVITLEPS